MEDLEKIDLLRRRADLSYEEARRLLIEHNHDVVEALIALEKQDRLRRRAQATGEIVAGLERLWRASKQTKFRLKQNEKTILELPVAAGLVGALLAPRVAILGAVAALFSRCMMEVVPPAAEG